MNLINRLKVKFRRIAYSIRHDFFNRERIVLIVAAVFCVSWTLGAISAMSRNWELSQRLESRKRDLSLLQLEVETMELENQFYRSEEYQELSARAKQNKKLPDETLIYLPENTPYAKEKYKTTIASNSQPELSNFEQWMIFLFGRQS